MKYIKEGGGTQKHIHGNVQADELAKQGAGTIDIKNYQYFLYTLRESVTRTVQDMMVDIWRSEKNYRVQQGIEQELLDEEAAIINAMGEENDAPDYSDDEDFDPIDMDGNSITPPTGIGTAKNADLGGTNPPREIGRASCRERV